MIKHYVNQIIAMDILADAITIIDKKGIIQYYKVFQKAASPFLSSEVVEKHFLDVFINIKPNESTVLKSLSGQVSINSHFFVASFDNSVQEIVENVYPVRLGDQVIGAVCVSQNITNYKESRYTNSIPKTAFFLYNIQYYR